MRALTFLPLGKTIYIEDIGGGSRTYKVVEHLSKGLVVCQATSKKDYPLQNLDERVTLICPVDNGVHLILSWIRESHHNGGKIIVDPVGKMWFVERRRYFRLRGPDVTAHYAIVDKNDKLASGMASGLVWDLSGNGIALFVRSDKTIKSQKKIHLVITLPDQTQISLTGKIIRCAHQKQQRQEHLLGIHFTTIDEVDREKIINYVIQEQLASMKRQCVYDKRFHAGWPFACML
jgi:Tfp pilus assembly protein PilZ